MSLVKEINAMPQGLDACKLLGRTADRYYIVTDGTFYYRIPQDEANHHLSPQKLEWFETAVAEYQKGLAPANESSALEQPEGALSRYVHATWVLPLACHECSKVSDDLISLLLCLTLDKSFSLDVRPTNHDIQHSFLLPQAWIKARQGDVPRPDMHRRHTVGTVQSLSSQESSDADSDDVLGPLPGSFKARDEELDRPFICPHADEHPMDGKYIATFTRKDHLKGHLQSFHPNSEYLVDFNLKFKTRNAMMARRTRATSDSSDISLATLSRQNARIKDLEKELRLVRREVTQLEVAHGKISMRHKTEIDNVCRQNAKLKETLEKVRADLFTSQKINGNYVEKTARYEALQHSEKQFQELQKMQYPQQIQALTQQVRELDAENHRLKLQNELLRGFDLARIGSHFESSHANVSSESKLSQ